MYPAWSFLDTQSAEMRPTRCRPRPTESVVSRQATRWSRHSTDWAAGTGTHHHVMLMLATTAAIIIVTLHNNSGSGRCGRHSSSEVTLGYSMQLCMWTSSAQAVRPSFYQSAVQQGQQLPRPLTNRLLGSL